jgi:hypothetical protein
MLCDISASPATIAKAKMGLEVTVSSMRIKERNLQLLKERG